MDFLTGARHPVDRFPPALNYYLADDIRVLAARQVGLEFHSRRWATGRVYQYRILARPEPTALFRHSHLWERGSLDIARMEKGAAVLVGTHDFRVIASGHPKDRSAVRTVSRWEVTRHEDTVIIECEANGFLKQQIRKANGILLEIGKGRQPVDLMARTLAGEDGTQDVPLLPARGLCLMEVKYPEGALDYPPMETGHDS